MQNILIVVSICFFGVLTAFQDSLYGYMLPEHKKLDDENERLIKNIDSLIVVKRCIPQDTLDYYKKIHKAYE